MKLARIRRISLLSREAVRPFYVDAVNGNDANSGRSASQAWKSLNRTKISPASSLRYFYSDWSSNAPYYDFSTYSDGNMPSGWLSSNFSLASGTATNSPTVGSTLLTDGLMENWTTATNLTSWTESVAGTSSVNREATVKDEGTYAARLDVDASNSAVSIDQTITNSLGVWLVTRFRAKCSATSCSMVMRENGTGQLYQPLTTTYTTYLNTHRALAANTNIKFGKDTASSKSIYLDAISAKVINIASCFAFRTDPAPSVDVRATAALTMPIIGALAGVAVKWDSTSNPQNGLIAYIGGAYPEYIYLDQCVAGTWSNLLKVQMTTSVITSYLDGEFIEVSVTGQTATVRYRGGIIGTPQTINAALANNKYCGLFCTDSSVSINSFAIDYRTSMVTPESLPSNITANHQLDRRLYGATSAGDMGGMASGTTGTADPTRIKRVISPTRGGLYACKFEIRNGDFAGSTNSGERAEIYTLHNPTGSDVSENSSSGTVYYGMSIYIPTDWSPPMELDPNSHSIWGTVTQLHPPAPGSLPSISLCVRDTIYVSNSGGNLEGTYQNWTETQLSDNSVKKGQWTDFVMKVVFANTFTGEIQIWRRNMGQTAFTSVLDLTNIPTLLTQSGYVDGIHIWRRGYYRAQQTSINTTILHQGPFVRGSTFNDVVAAAFG